jgi:hypothetical protein
MRHCLYSFQIQDMVAGLQIDIPGWTLPPGKNGRNQILGGGGVTRGAIGFQERDRQVDIRVEQGRHYRQAFKESRLEASPAVSQRVFRVWRNLPILQGLLR